MTSKQLNNLIIPVKYIPYAFQPIFDVRGDVPKLFGYEALMRPEEYTPLEYIEKMEKENKIHELEFLTFYNSIKQFRDRKYEGTLFINSFPYEILNKSEISILTDLLKLIDFKNEIYVESLEYGEYINLMRLTQKMNFLTENNFKLVLDDFGTGINSIGTMNILNPHIVKIDRHFIKHCTENNIKKNTIEIFISALKPYKTLILAEGVETKEEYDYLKQLEVDYMQGFYLGCPV